MSNLLDFPLQRRTVKTAEREPEEYANAPFKVKESLAVSFLHLLFSSPHCGRIGNAPRCRYGGIGPNRANLFGGVVADGKNEIELGSIFARKLVPALAAEAPGRN